MARRVQLRSPGMQALLKDPGLAADLRRRAEAVAARARANAPVDEGDFRDSITVQSDTTDRAVARVVSSDPKARVVEARTGVMSAALDAAGG